MSDGETMGLPFIKKPASVRLATHSKSKRITTPSLQMNHRPKCSREAIKLLEENIRENL